MGLTRLSPGSTCGCVTALLGCTNCIIPTSMPALHLSFTDPVFGPGSGTMTYGALGGAQMGVAGHFGPGGTIPFTAAISCDPVAGLVFRWCAFYAGSTWCCDTNDQLLITSLSCSPTAFLLTVVPDVTDIYSDCYTAVNNTTSWTVAS